MGNICLRYCAVSVSACFFLADFQIRPNGEGPVEGLDGSHTKECGAADRSCCHQADATRFILRRSNRSNTVPVVSGRLRLDIFGFVPISIN
jgi:hypothetical protein